MSDEGDEFGLAMRDCDSCGMSLPLTATMFDRDNSDAQGFKRICKQCRSEQRQKRADKELDERITQFDKKSLALLDRAVAEGSDIPHIGEIFENVIRLVGGVGGFAGHLVAQMLATKIGSKERSAILKLIVTMAERVTESGVATVRLDMLTDEDLEKLHRKKLELLLGQSKVIAEVQNVVKHLERKDAKEQMEFERLEMEQAERRRREDATYNEGAPKGLTVEPTDS